MGGQDAVPTQYPTSHAQVVSGPGFGTSQQATYTTTSHHIVEPVAGGTSAVAPLSTTYTSGYNKGVYTPTAAGGAPLQQGSHVSGGSATRH